MTTFYLIRHATTDFLNNTIVGRLAGIHLNDRGHREAEALATRVSHEPIRHVFSSPLERCLETANPLARKLNLEIHSSDGLNEIDYGDWTGRTLAELRNVEEWKHWNTFRSVARIPAGETMAEASARMVAFIEEVRRDLPDQPVAVVSHGDPLRALILHCLGLSLDLIQRIELSPASVSVLSVGDGQAQIRSLNCQFTPEPIEI